MSELEKMSKGNFFIDGAPVHYPDLGDFGVCGKFWFNASTTPNYVTCEECKKIMIDSGMYISEGSEED